MKIEKFFIDEIGKECKIKFVAETQQESAMLYKLGNLIKKPNTYYGTVDTGETWAWLFIPLKGSEYDKMFGNLL